VARRELVEASGTQLDPAVVAVVLTIVDREAPAPVALAA
jgi:hypothetical protein